MGAIEIIALIVQLAEAGTSLLAQIQKASTLVAKLQTENRDATPEEWAELDTAFQQSKAALAAAIAGVS